MSSDKSMNIGILTGGGDCPGLNGAIRGVVKYGTRMYGDSFVGVKNGWEGLLGDGKDEGVVELDIDSVAGIISRGGSILHSSRSTPFDEDGGIEKLKENISSLELDGLVVIGGDGTLSVAYRLFEEEGVSVVGIPETIDNDIRGTDRTIGFSTACDIAMSSIDRIQSTAETHNRIFIVELMGRDTGWITLTAGIASGADIILIPEYPIDPDDILKKIEDRRERGRDFTVIAVAEGYPFEGEGSKENVAHRLADFVREKTDVEVRVPILGHLQRGGNPNSYDRYLATHLGRKAVELVHEGRFGYMSSVKGNDIESTSMEVVFDSVKKVPQDLCETVNLIAG